MEPTNVCGACRAPVPYGRLSCPECGELLASVAGTYRRPGVVPIPATVETTAEAGVEASHGGNDRHIDEVVAWPERSAGLDDPDGTSPVADAVAPRPAAPTLPLPGAYVPPVIRESAPAPTLAPARTWGGMAPATNGASPAGAAATSLTTPDATSERRAMIDPAKATEFVGWLAIAGAALVIAGMILPWSTSVIGSTGGGYFDRWGLAGPGHLIVALATAGIIAAAVLRERVPQWLGVGLPGLGIGALLLGLTWPYVFGPLGGQLGASAVLVGSLMLVAAGIGALLVDRHARADRPV